MSLAHQRAVTIGLVASNAALFALVLYPELGRKIRKMIRVQIGRALSIPRSPCSSPQPVPSLKGYLGKDYEPPLPKPVADALERSCLCFLATAGMSNEPHLSLMRFTYSKGLEEDKSEVMILSTQRNTKKYEIITRNKNVALLVHDFDTAHGKDVANYEQLQGQTRYSITVC